jgi:parvulin-like peptidyl-prolyl isomerase
MRLMETIRRKGRAWLIGFMVFFLVSVFAGLGVGFFNANSGSSRKSNLPAEGAGVKKLVTEDAVMLVNGRPVSDKDFNDAYNNVRENMKQGSTDPGSALYAYGYMIRQLTTEGVLMGQAEELKASVSSEDLEKARENAIAPYIKQDDKAKGNLIGDLGQKVSSVREKKRAFIEYLERTGMTEAEWLVRAKRELLMDNAKKKLQDAADAEKKKAAELKKAEVDAALAKGEKFAEVSKKFSEDATAKEGGDIGTWVGRGLMFDEKVADAVFSTSIGKVTEWFDIPAGFQKFEIYDKREASGPEFEKEKPQLIEKLKKDKGDKAKDYVPTEDEIKKEYEAVKFRQILLKVTDEGAGETKLEELIKQATVEINDPFMLAFQALTGDKLQPVKSLTYDALVQIAKNSLAAEGYDYELIKTKLPSAPVADKVASSAEIADKAIEMAKSDTAAADATAEPGAAAEATAKPEAAAGTDAAATDKPAEPKKIEMQPEENKQPVPLYALGIGLLLKGLQDRGASAGYEPYYLLAKTYADWLQDDKQLKAQPVDRDKALLKIDEYITRVADSLDYNGAVFALQGLNLAWLNKPEAARKALEQAQKYAPQQPGSVWELLKKGYEVLGDTDKAKQIQTISDKLMQDYFQKQFAQQMQQQQQQGGGQSMPIQIPAQ